MQHPLADSDGIKLIANPIKMSGAPINYRNAPPILGQHTNEILEEVLEMGTDAISELKDKQVI